VIRRGREAMRGKLPPLTAPAAGAGPSFAYWSYAARPTLFNASACPGLITSLLLAHLMSPRLWDLSRRAVRSAGTDAGARLAAISRFVNNRFHHAGKLDFGRFWGLQERSRISDIVERAESDHAMLVLMHCMPRSISDEPTIRLMMDWLRHGLCPQYVYPTIEVIQALPSVCEKVSRRALGVTSCLDECVLIAALAVAAGCCRLSDLVFLGSPFHYAVFILAADCAAWLNGKRGMIDAASWHALTDGRSPADIQALFDDKMVLCDRIVAPGGFCRLPRGPTAFTAARATAIAERLRRFLGTDVTQVLKAVTCATAASGATDTTPLFARLDGCSDSSEFEARVLALTAETGDPVLEASLYTFRRPDVRHPDAYVSAAQRGFYAYLRAAEVVSVSDALTIAGSVAGTESVFGRSGRVALPDEALLLNTADRAERALLIHTLLKLSPSIGEEEKAAVALVGQPPDWRVTLRGRPVEETA